MDDKHKEKKSSGVIYLGLLDRWDKTIPALSRHFKIIRDDSILAKDPTICSDPTIKKQLKALIKLFPTYRELWRLRQDNPSLIVIGRGFSAYDIGLRIITKLLGLPFFVRLGGGMWQQVEDEWQFKPFPIKQLYRWYYSFCRHLVLSSVDGIIPVSYFLKNQIIYSTDIDIGKIMTVYNPINFAAFNEVKAGNFRKKLKIAANEQIILTVTGFNYYKKYMGIVYYLPTILRTLKENHGWYFVIVGGGYSFQQGRKRILEVVPKDMKDQIVFTGYYEPIEEAFRDADIVLHLTFRETAGNVVLEAQAAGKPVIVNYLGGMPELLQNRYHKPSCVIKEVSELYQSLTTLVKSKELREIIGQKNRQAVARKFTYESIGDDFQRCIKSLISEWRKFLPHQQR